MLCFIHANDPGMVSAALIGVSGVTRELAKRVAPDTPVYVAEYFL